MVNKPAEIDGLDAMESELDLPEALLTSTASEQRAGQLDLGFFREQIDHLDEQYLKVLDDVGDNFNRRGVSVSQVRNRLLRIPATLKYPYMKVVEEQSAQIEGATSVERLLTLVYNHSGFLNCGLLCHIVEKLGDAESKASMERYRESLRKFQEETRIGDFILCTKAIGCSALCIESGLVVKLGEGWRHRTLKDLEQFRCDLSRGLSLTNYAVQIRIVKPGSIAVVFGVPHSIDVADLRLKAAQLQQFCLLHSVSLITFVEVSDCVSVCVCACVCVCSFEYLNGFSEHF